MQDTFTKLGNPFITALLRSPLHGLMSKNTLLITYQGIRSGRSYTTPVNYVEDGELLWIISLRSRVWWRNLRGRTGVKLYWRGQLVDARAEVLEDRPMVAQALMHYLQLTPEFGRFMGVKLDPSGVPITEDVARAAHSRVIIKLLPMNV